MNSTERFVRDENLSRFVTRIEQEETPERREALRRLMIAEEDRYGSLHERLDKVDRLIVEAQSRIKGLELLPTKSQDLLEQTVANHRVALGYLFDYRRRVLGDLDRGMI